MGLSVVILDSNLAVAPRLSEALSTQFHAIHTVRSSAELHQRIADARPEAVIMNMEQFQLSDLRDLQRDFPALPIVCLYRNPDERVWVDALEAGAIDVCRTDDIQAIADSLRNSLTAITRDAA